MALVLLALFLVAEALGLLVANPGVQWYGALFLVLLLPLIALVWLRRILARRAPNLRVRVRYLTWVFTSSLLITLGLMMALPGIATQAAGVQGAVLANGLASWTSPDSLLPRAMRGMAGGAAYGFGVIERALFGDERVAPREARARQALTAGPAAGSPAQTGASGQAGGANGGTTAGGKTAGAATGVAGAEAGVPGAQGGISGAVPVAGGTASAGDGAGVSTGVVPVSPDAAAAGSVSGVATGSAPGGGVAVGVPGGPAVPGASAAVPGTAPGASVAVPGAVPGASVAVPGAAGAPAGAVAMVPSATASGRIGDSSDLKQPGGSISGQSGVAASPPARGGEPAGTVEVPIHREGNNILVDVVLFRRYPTRLLLDTGASWTTLSSAALRRFDMMPFDNAPKVAVNTAVGQQSGPLTLADSLVVGGRELKGVAVLQCDACAGPQHDGLLGMNVLSRFAFTVDQGAGVLRLEPRSSAADQLFDIKPFLSMNTRASAAQGRNTFAIHLFNGAPIPISTATVRLSLLDDAGQVVQTQDQRYATLPGWKGQTEVIVVPAGKAYARYRAELVAAQW